MPFASMSNVTSICGRPRGAGGMSVRLNWPSDLLPAAMSRSPCRTWIVTALWLSSAVENTCRSEEHTSELQSLAYLVCRLLLEKKKKQQAKQTHKHTITTHSLRQRPCGARYRVRYYYS